MFKCKTENCGPAGKILEEKKSTPLTIKMLHKSPWLWYKAITTDYFLIFVLFWWLRVKGSVQTSELYG